MCCGKICMACTCLILVVIAIGMLFGFGVFEHGFHKLKDTVHFDADSVSDSSRPFLGFPPPPPPF